MGPARGGSPPLGPGLDQTRVRVLFQIEVSWKDAAAAAAVLGAGAAAASLPRVRARFARASVVCAFCREAGLVLGLFALWQLAGSFSLLRLDRAVTRGQDIWDFERALHLPSELSLQRAVLPHHLLVQVMNLYYGWLHFPSLIALLVWLFVRHRDAYGRVRNTIVLLTGGCLLVQLVPVAPPRLVPALHVLDTPALYGQSVYGSLGRGVADQLSAMPSVHVGWAVLLGLVAVQVSPSRWRWLVVVHSVITFLAVSATGNHYWLDGVAAAGILVVALALQSAARTVAARVWPVVRAEPVPVLAASASEP